MANSNPLVDQGTINLLRPSLIVPSYPQLNVTAGFVGGEGIELALEGDATVYIETLTGGVTSPQPFQVCQLTMALIRAQALANQWKLQVESNSTIGDVTAKTDAAPLSSYTIINCAITTLRPLRMNGKTADWTVSIRGYYMINNQLWGVG